MTGEDSLDFEARIKLAEADIDKIKSQLHEIGTTARETGREMDETFTELGKSLSNIGTMVAGAFSLGALTDFVKKVFEVRSGIQDLESTMKVFLGSAEKATKFTKELQDYAYWNMFEFTDLTEASTQLLAYGTDVENVIGIIDKLSNIASATQKPLMDYINLYNRAKNIGSVDANAIRSWASSGLVLRDELAKMGDSAANGAISFEKLDAVLNKVTSDGGQFAGLMMAQMDNLSASWGQLEDNITNAMNEIGEGMQDYLKSGVDALSTLVDNYEVLGKLLMTAAAEFGIYKVAVLAAAAANKVAAVASSGLTAAEVIQYGALVALSKAQAFYNKVLLANPYVAAAAAVLALGTAIYGLTKAFGDSRSELEKINDAYDDRMRKVEDDVRVAEDHVRAINDEAKSFTQLKEAYAELLELPMFKDSNLSFEDVHLMNEKGELLDFIKNWHQVQEEQEESLRKEKMRNALIKEYNNLRNASINNNENKKQESREQILDLEANKIQDFILSIQSLSDAEKSNQFSQKIVEAQRNIENYEKQRNKLAKDLAAVKGKDAYARRQRAQLRSEMAVVEVGIEINENAKRAFQNEVNQLASKAQAEVDKAKAEAETNSLDATRKRLREIEKEIKKIRGKGNSIGASDRQQLNELLQEQKTLTSNYELMTGKQWTSAQKLNENIANLNRQVASEQNELEIRKTKDTIKQIELRHKAQMDAIDAEEKEFMKNNNGATSKAFNAKRTILRAKLELDIADAKRQLADFVKGIKIKTQAVIDNDQLKMMERAISMAGSLTEQLKRQRDLIKERYEISLRELQNTQEAEITDLKNKGIDAFNDDGSLNKEKYSTLTKEQQEAVDAIVEKHAKERASAELAYNTSLLDKQLDNYQQFVEKMLEIDEWYNDTSDAIADEAATKKWKRGEQTKVDEIRAADVQQATELLDGDDEFFTWLQEKMGEVSTMTFDQIKEQIQEVMGQLDAIDPTAISASQEKTYRKLQASLKVLNKQYEKTKQKAGDMEESMTDAQKTLLSNATAAQNVLSEVVESCRNVGDAFDEYLSDTAKEGLNLIQNVATSTISMIEGIKTVAITGAESMSAMEKASVILTIISTALQAAMAIANFIRNNLSKSAKIQEQIDSLSESYARLEKSIKKVQERMKDESGTDYWKSQIELARDYSRQMEIIREQMRLKQEQIDIATTKKRREALQEELDDFQDQYYDLMDKRRDAMNEFYETMATTDLKGMADTLAESIVDGFKNGLTDLKGVWDTTFQDLMKDMLTQQIKIQLQDRLKKVWSTIEKAFANGDTKLNEEEIERIRREYEKAESGAKAYLEQMQNLFRNLGMDEVLSGSSGAFEGMSQDTADELNGRFTALQISGNNIDIGMQNLNGVASQLRDEVMSFAQNFEVMLSIAADQLNVLNDIKDNTDGIIQTNRLLTDLRNKINSL